jgi:hypothetical protein
MPREIPSAPRSPADRTLRSSYMSNHIKDLCQRDRWYSGGNKHGHSHDTLLDVREDSDRLELLR